MGESVIREKSYRFALRIVELCRYLCCEKKEFVLSKQIVRSGTSIGANVEKASGSYSKKEFGSKISIAYKEARETCYWLRLITDAKYISGEKSAPYIKDCEELLKLLGSTKKTIEQNADNREVKSRSN